MSDDARTRRVMRRRGFLGALGVCLLAPGGATRAMMAGRSPDTPAARVDANTAASPWSGVVSVLVGGAAYSGVVLTPRHVLTAAHVPGGQPATALQVVANLGPTPATRQVEAVSLYPGTVFPYDDLCVLRLTQALPANVASYPLVDAPQTTGTRLTLVGYGASGQGNVGPSVAGSSSVKRVGLNVLDQFADRLDASGRTSPFWLYDFDGPTGTGAMGGPTLGNAVESCVAGGDSGSGAFIDTAAGPALYGLATLALSFGTAGTTSVFGAGGGGLVLSHPPYLEWLRTQTGGTLVLLSHANAADVPVAPPWALAALGAALMVPLVRRAQRG